MIPIALSLRLVIVYAALTYSSPVKKDLHDPSRTKTGDSPFGSSTSGNSSLAVSKSLFRSVDLLDAS